MVTTTATAICKVATTTTSRPCRNARAAEDDGNKATIMVTIMVNSSITSAIHLLENLNVGNIMQIVKKTSTPWARTVTTLNQAMQQQQEATVQSR